MNSNDLSTLLPEFALTVLVLVVLSTDLFLRREQKWLLTPITVIGLVVVGIACWEVWGVNQTVFAGFYRVDDLSVFFKVATVGDRHPGGPVRAGRTSPSGGCPSASST